MCFVILGMKLYIVGIKYIMEEINKIRLLKMEE